MEREQRNALARAVVEARRILEKELSDQLEGVYNILPDGRVLDEAPGDSVTRTRLLELIGHFRSGGASAIEARRRAVRESAFTILNRFAALKLAERRGIVRECISRGMDSEGIKELAGRAPGLGPSSEDGGYRLLLETVIDEISLSLRLLFERRHPLGLLWPRARVLESLLAILNASELDELWVSDETIGWVYQYFNADDVRRMRDDSEVPQSGRELAVRNQFFTPRYVVEFLTDNTLGRIWYEMRRGETALKERCRYLIWRTTDVFLSTAGEEPATQRLGETTKSGGAIPSTYVRYRLKKDPRDLRILDPAVGSGHFLLYSFDILVTVYEEAWADEDSPRAELSGRPLREDFPSLEELRRAVPELILRHNLYGVEIDPRCAQIASAALWLRAQRAWAAQGVFVTDRPNVQLNRIVVAEPIPGDEELVEKFVQSLDPLVLRGLFRAIVEDLKLAGDLGLLLRLEGSIERALADAAREAAEAGLFGDVPRADFWKRAEELLLEALKRFAQHTESVASDLRRQLFAADAVHGVTLIELVRRKFDVVLMNPPFGDPTDSSKEYIRTHYPGAAGNLLVAFVTRALELVTNGVVGAITDSTWLKKTSYAPFRGELVERGTLPVFLCDLGWEVLDDANVATCAFVSRQAHDLTTVVFRLSDTEADARADSLKQSIASFRLATDTQDPGTGVFVRPWTFFKNFPGNAIAYEAPDVLVRAFEQWRCLDPTYATCRRGYTPGDTFRFFRCWWEVSPSSRGKQWWTLNNGSAYAPVAGQGFSVSLFEKDWKSYQSPPGFRLEGEKWFGQEGLGYGKRTDWMYAYPLPAGSMFSNEGHCVFPKPDLRWPVLAYLNSSLCQALLNLYCGQHKTAGYVAKVPTPDPASTIMLEAGKYALAAWDAAAALFERDETSERFLSLFGQAEDSPAQSGTAIRAAAESYEQAVERLDETVLSLLTPGEATSLHDVRRSLSNRPRASASIISELVAGMTGEVLNPADIVQYCVGVAFGRWDVRFAGTHQLRPPRIDAFATLPAFPPGMLTSVSALRDPEPHDRGSQTRSLVELPEGAFAPTGIASRGLAISLFGTSLGSPASDGLVHAVRAVLSQLWGSKGPDVEAEIIQGLDVPTLDAYFARPSGFFAHHFERYARGSRRAPIYWPLSTASGSYTVWVYYPRLSHDILFRIVTEHVSPQLAQVAQRLAQLEAERQNKDGREAARVSKLLGELTEVKDALEAFKAELLHVAELPYRPDLNDGVQISAAPLWSLFRHKPWQALLKKTWLGLEGGNYDWAHLAYAIWPERVMEKRKTDKSLAIAHELKDLQEGDSAEGQPKKTRKSRR